MMWCISLGRAETGSGALDWFHVPLAELLDWAVAINDLEKKQKIAKRK